MQLDAKKIILTGAASGIGRALLTQLAQYECQIMAVDRQLDPLQAAIQAIALPKAQIVPYVCDLSQVAQVDQLFEAAIAQMGQIDLFIANAGFAYYEVLDQPDWERMERLFQVNVYSPIYSAVKMRQLYGNQPYKVVITASTMGHLAIAGYALYAATKAALHRFAEGYRQELDDPRKLMLVYPIATRTGFFEQASQAKRPYTPIPSQTPDYVAGHILQGILKDRQAVYTSHAFRLLSLLERPFPPLRRLPQWAEQINLWRWRRRSQA
jgi:short-subunit dehydrogenase